VLQGNGLLQLQLSSSMGAAAIAIWLANGGEHARVRRLLASRPWRCSLSPLYAFGFWLLLQPMQMRGVMMGDM